MSSAAATSAIAVFDSIRSLRRALASLGSSLASCGAKVERPSIASAVPSARLSTSASRSRVKIVRWARSAACSRIDSKAFVPITPETTETSTGRPFTRSGSAFSISWSTSASASGSRTRSSSTASTARLAKPSGSKIAWRA